MFLETPLLISRTTGINIHHGEHGEIVHIITALPQILIQLDIYEKYIISSFRNRKHSDESNKLRLSWSFKDFLSECFK
jgi:hypothetical protein